MVNYLTKGIFSVAGSAIHQICLFSLFIFSNLSVYIMSYLHHKGNEVTLENGYFLGTICCFTMNGFNFLGGVLDNKFGVHKTILTGSLILVLACTGLIFSTNLYLSYAIMVFFGLGYGIACMTSFKNACRYFPNKHGIITAIIGACGNAGSSLFNYIASIVINPDNIQIDKNQGEFYPADIAERFLTYLYIKLGSIAGMSIIASLMIFQFKTDRDEDVSSQLEPANLYNSSILDDEYSLENVNKSQLESSIRDIKQEEEETTAYKPRTYGSDIRKVLFSGRIWYLFLLFFSCSFGTNIIATTYFTFGTRQGISTTILTNTSIIYFTSSCFIGLIWGTIFDKYGFKTCIIIITTLGIICSSAFFYSKSIPYLFAGLIILNGGISSGTFSILFPHILTVFTPMYSTEAYGVVSMSVGSSSLISALFAFFVTKLFVDLNTAYNIVYLIGAGFSVIALILGIYESSKQFNFESEVKTR